MASIPLMMSAVLPPSSPRTLTEIMFAFLATPKVVDAAVPATWVLGIY